MHNQSHYKYIKVQKKCHLALDLHPTVGRGQMQSQSHGVRVLLPGSAGNPNVPGTPTSQKVGSIDYFSHI